jgi:hypothetical protein
MKKVLFIAAFAAISFTSSAQFAKGDSYISGGVGFSQAKTGSASTSNYAISPNYGYFVTNNIAVGVGLGFGGSTAKNAAGVKTVDASALSAGVFARYYTTPAKAFSFFGNLGVNYTSGTDKIPATDVKTTGFGIAIAPGISYFVSNRLAIESTIGSLGYSTSKTDVTGAVSTNNLGLNLNLSSISFGLVYKL